MGELTARGQFRFLLPYTMVSEDRCNFLVVALIRIEKPDQETPASKRARILGIVDQAEVI